MGFADIVLRVSNFLEKIFSYTVFVRFPKLDAMVAQTCLEYGLRDDYVRLFFSMAMSFPLAWIQTLFSNVIARKVYSLVFGVIILQFCFSTGWIHCLLSTTACYFIMKYCNPKRQPRYVFLFSLSYLSLMSIHMMIIDYMSYSLDATTYEMIIIAKVQMLAWSLYDGTVDRQTVDEGAAKSDRMARLYQRRQSRAISALPPLFDYYAYMFHFTGLLGGPTIYYTEYEDVMSKPAKRERYPAVLRTLLTGMVAFALFGATCQWHSLDDFLDPSIREKSLFSRLIVLYVFMLGMRCKYYGLWKLGESMCLLNGFGENEKTHEWSNMSNVDIMGFEFATNYSTTARTWNCRIQQWLQYCIYERSNFNQFLVFMVSAFWHGFYPGYYIGFSLASFMTHVGRLAYKKVWPRVEGTAYQSVFKMAMMMLCAYTNSWMLIAHMSYTVSRTMQIWRNFDFVHPVLLVVLCVLFTVMPTPKKKAD